MFPSLILLYFYGLINFDSIFSLKVVGHQWYWRYILRGFLKNFDSYIRSIDSLLLGDYRLIDVDNHCILSYNLNYRFCVCSRDVVHS